MSERLGELVAITPTGAALDALTADEVTVVDLAGEHVDGALAATSELDLHLGVYERFAAGGVVHTHAPMATALSCVLDELPCLHYQLLLLGGPVRVAPYRTFGTPALAAVTLDALEGRAAALMANHGAIAHGHDLDAAVQQRCCSSGAARSTGGPRPRHAARTRRAGARRRRDGGRRPRLRDDPAGAAMTVIAMGVHVVDVLARPIEEIPPGPGRPARRRDPHHRGGLGRGTAVTLAKLGAEVRSAGAIGTDALGDVLLDLLGRHGIDTALLVRRTDGADVGERPADPARRLASGVPRRRRERALRARRRRRGTPSPRRRTCTSGRPSSWAARRRRRSCPSRARTAS